MHPPARKSLFDLWICMCWFDRYICASASVCVCIPAYLFATACACECTGVSDTTGAQSCIHIFHFASLSDALTSWVVILTAVRALAGWQIGITDCLGYLDSKIAIKFTLIKLIFFSSPLIHWGKFQSYCNITDEDTCDSREAHLNIHALN